MSLPPFPDFVFPQTVTVKLTPDTVGRAGGANPAPESVGTSFRASVQDAGVAWDGMNNVSVSQIHVNFQVDPNASLSRPIRAGDTVFWGSLVLSAKGPVRNRGGMGFLWRLECEYVKT